MVFKNIIGTLVFAASCALAGPVYAESQDSDVEELKEKTRELGETLQDYGADQKRQAEDAINRTLSALDERIEELEKELAENWDDKSETARDRSQESLASLQEQRERVQKWYNELKASSASAWGRAKKGFSEAYEAFSEQWNETEKGLSLEQRKESESI